MTLVRSHLRLGVIVWLLGHTLTAVSLVACDCCRPAEGEVHTANAPPCHEVTPPPQPHCEHAAADGAACPMHRPAAPSSGSALSCACGTPDAMLVAVLLQPAVAVSVLTIDAPLDRPVPPTAHRPTAASLAVPPDAPPPRA